MCVINTSVFIFNLLISWMKMNADVKSSAPDPPFPRFVLGLSLVK